MDKWRAPWSSLQSLQQSRGKTKPGGPSGSTQEPTCPSQPAVLSTSSEHSHSLLLLPKAPQPSDPDHLLLGRQGRNHAGHWDLIAKVHTAQTCSQSKPETTTSNVKNMATALAFRVSPDTPRSSDSSAASISLADTILGPTAIPSDVSTSEISSWSWRWEEEDVQKQAGDTCWLCSGQGGRRQTKRRQDVMEDLSSKGGRWSRAGVRFQSTTMEHLELVCGSFWIRKYSSQP